MKLNKKGFTLVELLAVVVLLLSISAIAISSISAAIERNKNKQNETKKEMLKSLAVTYYKEHKNSYQSNGIINFDVLKDAFNLDDDDFLDANGNDFGGCIQVTENTNGKVTAKHITSGC